MNWTAAAGLACLLLPLAAQATAPVYQIYEAAFEAAKPPESPLTLRPRVIFTQPGGAEAAVEAFWDGGATFRVRFQPLRPGVHTFRVESSDPGLNGKTGQFTALRPTGPTDLDQHGPPSSPLTAATSPTPPANPGSGSPTLPGMAPCSPPATNGMNTSRPAPPNASPPSSSS